MNLFNKLVDKALKNQPKLLSLRTVVEKELLHHDILKILSENGILRHLTFMGGTALRACYGAHRLSEDLDFTGDVDFSRDSLSQMGEALKQGVYTKYGFAVEVSEPKQEKKTENNNVDTWQIKITTRPESTKLPLQRINIDICLLPSYEKRPMMLINPYGVDMGTSGLVLQVQSLEEIYTDKIIAFALRPNRLKYRDLWDIMWLRQRAITPNIKLLPSKLEDRKRSINEFTDLLEERLESLENPEHKAGFIQEMQHFLPSDQLHTLSQPEILITIASFISGSAFHIPLIKAAQNGDIALIKKLITLAISVNKQDPRDGKSALHWAAKFDGCSGYPDGVVGLLLKAGADLNIKDKEARTPLYYAVENSISLKTVQDLSSGVNDASIRDALEVAQYGGSVNDVRTEVVKYLWPKVNSPQPSQTPDFADYKKTVDRVDGLYVKHIKNLYDKPLTIKEIEEVIAELHDSNPLKKFRRLYKGRNALKPNLTEAECKKQKFLDEEITKFDTEVTPIYYLMQYLHSRNEPATIIQFSSTTQNNRGYDALLTLKQGIIKHLECIRAIDDGEKDLGQNDKKSGQQEMYHVQLLRQDGCAMDGRVDYNEDLGYVQLFPRAAINLSTDKYPKMLLQAWQNKVNNNSKKKVEQNPYDWLIITLPADFNKSQEFTETCTIFYQSIIQNHNIGFERIFIVIENRREGQSFEDLIWDSKVYSLGDKNA